MAPVTSRNWSRGLEGRKEEVEEEAVTVVTEVTVGEGEEEGVEAFGGETQHL